MQQIIDPTTPRGQLPFDKLPRGFVPWPQRILGWQEAAQHLHDNTVKVAQA